MLSPSDYSKVKDKGASDQLFRLFVEGRFKEIEKALELIYEVRDISEKATNQYLGMLEKETKNLKEEISYVREVATRAKEKARETGMSLAFIKDDLRANNKPTLLERFYKLIK